MDVIILCAYAHKMIGWKYKDRINPNISLGLAL